MSKKYLLITLFLFVCSWAAFAYDTMEMEKDFKEIIRLGDRVYKSSIKASRVLSDTLVKDGTPTNSISASQISIVQQELTTEDKDKIELQVSGMQAGDLDEYMPKPNNFNTEGLEKLISQKRKGQARKPAAKIEAAPKLSRKDKNLVAKVFPDANLINEILVSTHQTSANPAKLDSDSVQFRDKCVSMFNQLVKRGEAAARIKFYELLSKKENKGTRWYFAGIAAMVAGFPEFEREAAVQNLKKIIPELQKEAKTAVKAVDWDFAVAIESMPEARASFKKSLDAKQISPWKDGIITNITPTGTAGSLWKNSKVKRSSSAKRGFWSSSSNKGNKERGKLSVGYWSECWDNMWGDMADQLQPSFDQGTNYGQRCGEFIGLASGIGQAFGKILKEKTMQNISNQVRDYAYDTAIGETGMKPDPYSIVGHYAGGAIGTLGGAIGNAAGWVVGTVEAIAAQRGGKSSRSRAKKGAPTADEDEMIKLF